MIKVLRAAILCVILPFMSIGQVQLPSPQTDALDTLRNYFQLKWQADSIRAVEMGFPMVQTNDHQTISFVGFEGNRPIYSSQTTLSEVQSYYGQQLWALPYGVTGTGYPGAIWEAFAGSAALPDATNGNLLTNGALPSRISLLNTGTTSSHATNVALRIVGDGSASATTGVGPAKTANLAAWDVSNVYTEMAANIGSYLVSNHSYAEIHGWTSPISITLGGVTKSINWWSESNVSKIEDYGFGRYGSSDYNLDLLANGAPYHCIVKAAGNDRNDIGSTPVTTFNTVDGGVTYTFDTYSSPVPEQDGGSDGFDCLPSGAVAKNAFIIGSCNTISGGYSTPADVTTPSFSNYGPTDDGRIKPDFVAPGPGGTSYASPNVAGTILLLQEIYNNTFGGFMKSATVKALLAQTAFEAGSAIGPDYKHGWGLINPVGAADLIVDQTGTTRINEATLADGDAAFYLVYSDGISPITATLCWTDPESSPTARTYGPGDLNNATIKLVHDLDMRLVDLATNTVQASPYVLDPANPANPATTGDNFRDNVEKIHLAAPTAGWYAIRINHKATLASPQDYSLIISGAKGGACAGTFPTIDNEWNGSAWSNTFVNGQNVIINGTLPINSNTAFGATVLSPNAVLTVGSGIKLEIQGDVWAFQNVLFNGSGDLELSGSSVQQWCGGAHLKSLAIQNSNGVQLSGKAISVDDSVVLRLGQLATNGNLILASSSGNYAQIHEDGGSMSGQIEFQQTITSNGWHHIASPVNTTIGDLLEDMDQYKLAASGGNIYSWDEASGAWAHPLDTTIVFDVNSPFNTFFGTSGPHTFSPVPFTIRLSGVPNSGSVNNTVVYGPSTAISNGQGWNFIANPYPENLKWSTIQANFGGFNINNSYYVWDAATLNYRLHDGTTGDAQLGGFIAPGQAFFVRLNDVAAEATTAFDFTNANRSLTAASFFKTEISQLKLMATQDNQEDVFYLVFEDGNTVDLQPNKDAFKLFSPSQHMPQLYQFVDSSNSMAMNYVPRNFDALAIPLSFLNGEEGEAEIRADVALINANWKVVLEDKWLVNFHNLRQSAYRFKHSGNNSPNRFVIHINKRELTGENSPSELTVWGSNGHINLQLNHAVDNVQITITNSVGQTLHQSSHAHLESFQLPFSQHGVFMVQLRLANGKVLVQKWVN